MPYFNTIDCVISAYRLIWRERAYLLKLAAIPLFIKFSFYMIATMYGEEGNVIRLSVFMVPAYFAEGWMLCHFIRLISNGQRWPYQMTGDDAEDLRVVKRRAKPLLAGVVSFVLINLFIALYFTIFKYFTPPEMMNGGDIKPEDISKGTAITIIFLFALMVAGFKLVWLYVPMAANMKATMYIERMRGFGITVRLIGLWLLCFVPVMVLMQILISPFLAVETQAASVQVLISIMVVIFDTLKNLIVTAGMTLAILQITQGHNKGKG